MKINFNAIDDLPEDWMKDFFKQYYLEHGHDPLSQAEFEEALESYVKNRNGKDLIERIKNKENVNLSIDVGYPLGSLEIDFQEGEIKNVDYKDRDEK